MKLNIIPFILGYILDLCLGDPHWLFHPVRIIGFLIQKTEVILRKLFPPTKKNLLFAGFLLVLFVTIIVTFSCFFLLVITKKIHPLLSFLCETIMCYQLLATKSLKDESMKVYQALKENNIQKARTAVSMIVGRDTNQLSEEEIAKAAVETIAENSSDGVIAPMFFLFLGGIPLGFLYKTINTLDSMVGYHNENYEYFGKTAAKCDDLFNFIPARICAFFMLIVTFIFSLFADYSFKQALYIYKKDRYNHKSPNSAHAEAVCAGALNITLAGDAYYFGILCKKPFIGNGKEKVTYIHIKKANKLLYGTSFFGFIFFCFLKLFLLL